MNHALTAQDLFTEMKRMPATERVKFFSLLSSNAFRDDDFSHERHACQSYKSRRQFFPARRMAPQAMSSKSCIRPVCRPMKFLRF